ncbi:hypothetical protein M1B34_18050 [Pseudomonas sp. MAFF 302030]|uniref:Uncharacterized protein n=1 Tax=Pseudomonas morbosilactucae TaxID=2938197 RepID=A0A9X1YXR9_9PSED|nr:hypothetical protein [Pseudomonas morbosilactucae]MCK9799556.1 hypothetical protein [Pseudomonas morbosilactucae]
MSQEHTPDFTQLPAGAVAFPEASEVFVADQQELARHLHPLLSVDASRINPQWSGHLHLLSPLEPDEGLVGELTEDWFLHSDLVKTNWIGFKLEDGRYRLCGDPRYFFLHPDNTQLHEAEPRQVKKLQAYYAEQQASFEATRQHYREHGHLVRTDWEDAGRWSLSSLWAVTSMVAPTGWKPWNSPCTSSKPMTTAVTPRSGP